MNNLIVSREELFGPKCTVEAPKPKKQRKTVGASETELVNQLSILRSATVFYDLYAEICQTAQSHKLNLYVYRRDKGPHYRHRYYWSIYAVKTGIPKANHPHELMEVTASIQEFPYKINPHRGSKQYKLLLTFLQKLQEAT